MFSPTTRAVAVSLAFLCIPALHFTFHPGSSARASLYASESAGPSNRQERINASFDGQNIQEALQHLQEVSGIRINYRPGDLPAASVDLRLFNTTLPNALRLILEKTDLGWEVRDDGVHVHAASNDNTAAMARWRDTGMEPAVFAQADGNPNNWRVDADNDNNARAVERGARVPGKRLGNRAGSLANLITSVIEPGRWRRPETEPEETPEPDEEINDDLWR